ncbi:MAG: hypothetical protein LM587_02125 [Candidatus Aenigmarchaeota archaeon]|nr:hypothetical protein [Candidatus Aenigmarchaeota archaeon]
MYERHIPKTETLHSYLGNSKTLPATQSNELYLPVKQKLSEILGRRPENGNDIIVLVVVV